MEVTGTLTEAASAVSFCIRIVGLRARHRDLVVGRINLHQHRSRLDVLVVLHIELDDVPGDPRTDGVHVAVDLRVIGGFVAR